MDAGNLNLQEELNLLKAENGRLNALNNGHENSLFETIFDKSALGNKIINSDLEIVRVNKALLRLLKYKKKELIGSSILNFVHPDHRDQWNELRSELWSNQKPSFSIDTCIIRKDKTSVWCHVTSIIFPDKGETLGYTILEDITERMELERLRGQSKDLQFSLEKMEIDAANRKNSIGLVLETQENERKRIAESLHNGIGQLLFGVKLSLDRVKDNINTEERASFLQHSKNLLEDAIKESRRISHELMPSVLQDFGLKLAIDDICSQFRGTLSLRCEVKGQVDELPKYLSTAIFRIVQELVLNIVKHALADAARIRLSRVNETIKLEVEDNGKGFNVEANSDGIGLRTMQSKVQLLNGKIKIISEENKGTRTTINLPIDWSQKVQ